MELGSPLPLNLLAVFHLILRYVLPIENCWFPVFGLLPGFCSGLMLWPFAQLKESFLLLAGFQEGICSSFLCLPGSWLCLSTCCIGFF